MGKRSFFKRCPQDFYRTSRDAALVLRPHLPPKTRFMEPCAGKGHLITWLTEFGHICTHARDIRSAVASRQARHGGEVYVTRGRAEAVTDRLCDQTDYIITNPPWSWTKLEPILKHFVSMGVPSWFLLSADQMSNLRFAPFLSAACIKVLPVGRVNWIEGTSQVGKDNSAWYLFDPYAAQETPGPTVYPRLSKVELLEGV